MRSASNLHTVTFPLLLVIVSMLAYPAAAQDRLASLIGDGSVMLRSPGGEPLVSLNPDQPLVPASIVKIPLSQVALTTLGEDYRFETHFYRNDDGDMLIRGLGDPFLVSEEIARIAGIIAERGVKQIRRLVLDDSAFEENPDLPLEENSSQPYAARNSALAVNFNTVNLAWTAQGELISGEPQTPLTAIARELGSKYSAGNEQRINLGDNPEKALQQAEQLFRYFLEESGITIIDSNFYYETISQDWTLFYQHSSSRSLRENLDGVLRYSNNFIANQIFLTLGAHVNGYPATVESAKAVLQDQLTELYGDNFGRNPNSLLMVEGSGLSREQRSTAAGMMQILEAFKPYSKLLPEVDGVLRKSGTLTGVYNFAGYIAGSDGLYPFVILTNQAANNRAAILRELKRQVPQ